ncbi:solute carrier family 12 member 6-like [Cuculus canorus]|uniref:solute carrier family 12 member 6-like n=1 Tax=Cuculus canorus TaxID=55661 RepID=UPI0023AAACAC|nr:solute carrier family 12 member 6-like [Cuculus canorus]
MSSSSSSPEPPSPSSSRPPGSSASPSPSAEALPPPAGPALRGGDPGPPRDLALFEEELATRPRVPAVLRRMAPYSALSPGSDRGPGRASGALRAVALPALQTPLGLVLVLRLPWVVGTGGLLQAGAIALLLGACTALTSVSLSAVATNGPDPGGCPLSLLSGALGPEAGGAVGLCAFLSAAFAAATAALGAAELLMVCVGPRGAVQPGRGRWWRLNAGRGLGAAVLALLALAAACPHAEPVAAPASPAGLTLALLGLAAGAVRNAFASHALCLPSRPGGHLEPCVGNGSQRNRPAFPGPSAHLLQQNLWPRPPEEEDEDWSFGALVGLSLLSAAGPLWGCGRWGALGDAPRSVAAGSLGAAATTTGAFALAALALGGSVEGRLLRARWSRGPWGAWWPGPWVPALSGLTSGAAVGLTALAGGARLLRGLARSRALPLPHALGSGRLWPLAATSAMAALGVLLGSLDLVAPVLSVFCLTSYLGLNLACALQGLLPTPGWAPRCRLYHWALSLAGAALCLALAPLPCWPCALLALGIGATAYKYLEYRGAQSEWGEGLRGLFLSAARFALLRLEDGEPPAPSWRPQLLVLVKLDAALRPTQPQLLALAAQLQTGKGLTVLGSVLPGELPGDLPRARHAETALREALAAEGARGFVQVLVGPGGARGFPKELGSLVQGCGLGALRPNAVLLGWPRREPPHARAFVELLRVSGAGGRAVLVAKGPLELGVQGGTLDVWWVVGDGRLLTLLPLLLRRHPSWRGSRVRLFAVASLRENSLGLRRLLEAEARRRGLQAQAHVVELDDSDVSADAYERTLMMEQRAQMLRQMQLARAAQGGPPPSVAPSAAEEEDEEEEGPLRGPSLGNVRRMHAAQRLNAAVGQHSGGARLVLLDLPPPPPRRRPESYLEFLEVLTEGLGPVLLVRGGDDTSMDQYGPVQTSTTPV